MAGSRGAGGGFLSLQGVLLIYQLFAFQQRPRERRAVPHTQSPAGCSTVGWERQKVYSPSVFFDSVFCERILRERVLRVCSRKSMFCESVFSKCALRVHSPSEFFDSPTPFSDAVPRLSLSLSALRPCALRLYSRLHTRREREMQSGTNQACREPAIVERFSVCVCVANAQTVAA